MTTAITDAHTDYALTIRSWSERIIGAVHDDGPDELLAHITAALREPAAPGVNPVVALVTVLASQVDPEATAGQRFGWITQPAHAVRTTRPSTRRIPLLPCGTLAAYRRHRRHREVPCRACTIAHSDHDRERRHRAAAARKDNEAAPDGS